MIFLRVLLSLPVLLLGTILLISTLLVLHFSSWLSPHCQFKQTNKPGQKQDKIVLEWIWGKE